jgi:hypothetical protein
MNNPDLAGRNKGEPYIVRYACVPIFDFRSGIAIGRSRVEEEKAACRTPPYDVYRTRLYIFVDTPFAFLAKRVAMEISYTARHEF